jgi:TPR repeat protein
MGKAVMTMQSQANVAGDVPQSFFARGLACSNGRAGEVDLVEAHKWFNIAAAGGDRAAARHREELAREMSREQIAAALRAAREWLSRPERFEERTFTRAA